MRLTLARSLSERFLSAPSSGRVIFFSDVDSERLAELVGTGIVQYVVLYLEGHAVEDAEIARRLDLGLACIDRAGSGDARASKSDAVLHFIMR